MILKAGMMAVGLLTGAAQMSPAPAEDRYFMEFSGAWLGFVPVGDLALDAFLNATSYEISAVMRSGGIAALFDRTTLSATAAGSMTPSGPAWGRYDLDHVYAAKRRVTQMRGRSDGGVDTMVTPAHGDLGDPKATAAQADAARDPLTAIFTLGLDVARTWRCTGAADVWDGRFLYRLSLTPKGYLRRHAQGGYDGPALRCALRLTPIAGYDAKERNEAARWPTAEVWFGLIGGSRLAPPVHIVAPFALGDVSLTLRTFLRVQVSLDDALPALPPSLPP